MARNDRRVRAALIRTAEALEFAELQAAAAAEAPGAWRWCAIASCMALQGALVAALSGYDTADPGDVLHPEAGPDLAKVAPIATLLRRASSGQVLNDPERLGAMSGAKRQALALVELRNRAVHVDLSDAGLDLSDVPRLLPGPVRLMTHLVCLHPAFPAASFQPWQGQIARHLTALRDRVC
ncbi:MAG: hypothetical protein AAGH87_10975 [Pseudomonadota bacterium]